LYTVGGTAVLACVGIGVAVRVDVEGSGVGVSVGGGSVGVAAKVAVGASVGGTGGVAARDRNCNPPMANSASTITPPTRAKSLRGDFCATGCGGTTGCGAMNEPEDVNSAPQIRHVLARDETLDPQLGQVLGCVSEGPERFSMRFSSANYTNHR